MRAHDRLGADAADRRRAARRRSHDRRSPDGRARSPRAGRTIGARVRAPRRAARATTVAGETERDIDERHHDGFDIRALGRGETARRSPVSSEDSCPSAQSRVVHERDAAIDAGTARRTSRVMRSAGDDDDLGKAAVEEGPDEPCEERVGAIRRAAAPPSAGPSVTTRRAARMTPRTTRTCPTQMCNTRRNDAL